MVDIVSKLPGMADEQLTILRGNAERLETSGTAAQQKSAAALLPAVRAEIASRHTAKLATVREKAAAAREKAPRKPARKKPAAG